MGAPGAEKAVAFRWRNDDGSESTATWREAAGVNATLSLDTIYRIRVNTEPDPTGAAGGPVTWNYNHMAAGAVQITTSSTIVKATNSSNITDGEATTEQMAGAGTFLGGTVTEDGTQSCVAVSVGSNSEQELVLTIPAAGGAVAGDTGEIVFVGGGTNTVTIGYTIASPAGHKNLPIMGAG